MRAYAERSYSISNFWTPQLIQIFFFYFLPIFYTNFPLIISSYLLTQLNPSICTVVFSPLEFVPFIVGSLIKGISASFNLLSTISRVTRTAVSVASCSQPKWRILLKYLRTGAGRSRGGWSPRIPPNTSVDHFSSGLSSFSPLISSIQTGSLS